MKRTWEAIVFDLDGTLANTLLDLAESTNAALIKNGWQPYPAGDYRMMVGDGLRRLVERAADGASASMIDRIMADFLGIYDQNCLKNTRPYEGMPETLEELKAAGIPLLVITNKPDAQAQKIVANLFGAGFFDGIFGGREGRKTKPDPALTLKALDYVHAVPAGSLFVGDSNVDVRTAANAGMRSAGAMWGFRGKEELEKAGADYLLTEPRDILKIRFEKS